MRGRLSKQSAGDLGISEVTVKVHRGNPMRKMKATLLPELGRMAANLSLVSFRPKACQTGHSVPHFSIAISCRRAEAPIACICNLPSIPPVATLELRSRSGRQGVGALFAAASEPRFIPFRPTHNGLAGGPAATLIF